MTEISFDKHAVVASGVGWLAVDKPALMSVHNEPEQDLISKLFSILKRDRKLKEKTIPDFSFGLHPVHRLDRETSGVILLACQKEVFRYLADQFQERSVQKTYLAVLHGHPNISKDEWRLWKWPLSKSSGGRKNPSGIGKKLESLTKFRILEYTHRYTKVECQPLTGRKHQIRRHAKLFGHPILGDNRYGSTRASSYLKEHHQFSRLALHSAKLIFTPKDIKQEIVVQSRCFPAEIQKVMDADQKET